MAKKSTEKIARDFYESDRVVTHYFRVGQRIGLWESEKLLFGRLFSRKQRILDLGCGTGRIAFGLENLGYTSLDAVDFSAAMIENALLVADGLQSSVRFRQADARELPWGDAVFDGVIFGFNGLFTIPGSDERNKALMEIHRVLKPGGRFIFTGHDRKLANQASHWSRKSAESGEEPVGSFEMEFGDVMEETELGLMYIHSTSQKEVTAQLAQVGFLQVDTWLRRELGNESSSVREFADECRFWAALKAE